MAESYQTEEEQIEALKSWWRENGKSTIAIVAVSVAAYLGWQGWQQQQQTDIADASAIYQNLLTAANADNGNASVSQLTTAASLADTLKADFPDTSYARFGAFYKAKFAVDNKDLAGAEQELRWVLASAPGAEVNQQATLRLARVLTAQEQYSEAMTLLDSSSTAYAAQFEEARGDLYRSQGLPAQAALAYQKASELSAQASNSPANPLLAMKIQYLSSGPVSASQADGASQPTAPAADDSAAPVAKEGA